MDIDTTALTDGEMLLRGYDPADESYQYVTFGQYPFEKNGTVRPCVWRVLAIENNYAFLWSEYIVDAALYHHERKDLPVWKDYDIYQYLNVDMLETMFSEKEQAALRNSDDFGRLIILDNNELMRESYGFRHVLTKPLKERICTATPYVKYVKKLHIQEGGSMYWSRTCRHVAIGGFQYIIGYDGHISIGSNLRKGGIRPACYVDLTLLTDAKGSGTLDDPYSFAISRK